MEMNSYSSEEISYVERNVSTQQNHDNEYLEEYDERSEEGQYVEPSTLSEAPVYEAVSRVYQLNDKMEHDEHVYNMVKKQIKTRIWPYTKFSTVDIINETECYEEGNYLHLILTGMNLLSYNRVQRVRFWLRYGKVVLEVLSVCKCNVASGLKKSVVQRK
jgi:hypothetical protein